MSSVGVWVDTNHAVDVSDGRRGGGKGVGIAFAEAVAGKVGSCPCCDSEPAVLLVPTAVSSSTVCSKQKQLGARHGMHWAPGGPLLETSAAGTATAMKSGQARLEGQLWTIGEGDAISAMTRGSAWCGIR
eukprot:gene38102-58358_t